MKAQSERPDISEMPPYRLGVCLLTVPVLRAASASARRRFSSSMNFMSISLSHSGKRLRWIVCQWRPSLYLTPLSLLSSMFSPRQSAPCANWNISASKSTRSTRSTRPSKKVLQLPHYNKKRPGNIFHPIVEDNYDPTQATSRNSASLRLCASHSTDEYRPNSP